ncbi:MAG: pantoate--beta-alanine ligase [Vicinamibacterales bacterium]
MTVVETPAALGLALAGRRGAGRVVGFVPTMGALHDGHARLMAVASAACDVVVVSIFVNPLQFDRADDLAHYPRTLEGDLELCRALGVDVVFTPGADDIYPSPPVCTVDVGTLADHLCGRFRPGHFQGVATVVLKLLNMVQPQRAYFGEKDAQQLAIIRRMVHDFNVPVSIVGVPTVREADGVALSSRNRLLTAEERAAAPALIAALREAERLVKSGGTDAGAMRAAAVALIPPHPGLRLEYLELVDPQSLQPVADIAGPVLAAGALWVGSTRLIDNVLCQP